MPPPGRRMSKRAAQRRPQQAAAIPYRRAGGRLQFCLVTSSGSGRWVIPKGTIENGQKARHTALQEAREEAGLRGRIVGEAVGCYQYEKWGTVFTVAAFLMEVSKAATEWDERAFRRRCWVSAAEAARRLGKHPARHVFQRAVGTLKASARRRSDS